MRTTITTASVVAPLATGAGSASARAIDTPIARANPGIHAHVTSHKAEVPYSLHHTSPDAQDVARGVYPGMQLVQAAVAPARPVVADSGFDWADAGIGAGFAAVVLLSAAGASALRRPHPTAR